MPTMMRVVISASATAVFALSLSGCGDSESPASSEGTPIKISAQTPGTLSVTQVGVPYAERRQLLLAQEKLIQNCMEKAGFKYTPAPISETQRDRSWQRFDDVERARREGYGILANLKKANADRSNRANPASADLANLTQEQRRRYQLALHGTNRKQVDSGVSKGITVAVDGCLAEGSRILYGDPVEWASLSTFATNFQTFSERKALDSVEVKVVTRKWSACMATKGYHFRDREAAIASIEYGSKSGADQPVLNLPDAPSKKEIDTAVADAGCDKQVGLSEVTEEKIKEAIDSSAKEHQSELLGYREKQQKALAIAADILK